MARYRHCLSGSSALDSSPCARRHRVLEAYTKKNSLFAKGMCLCNTYISARCCTERKTLRLPAHKAHSSASLPSSTSRYAYSNHSKNIYFFSFGRSKSINRQKKLMDLRADLHLRDRFKKKYCHCRPQGVRNPGENFFNIV